MGWKRNIREALEPAKEKIQQYYSQTSSSGGLLYNVGLVLDPRKKLSVYEEWPVEDPNQESWADQYKREFLNYYRSYYKGLERQTTSLSIELTLIITSSTQNMTMMEELDMTVTRRRSAKHSANQTVKIVQPPSLLNKAEQYLDELLEPSTTKILDYWQLNQSKYLTLS